nr:nucleotidyltransferase family protein [Pyrinomonadaceae bacterium]
RRATALLDSEGYAIDPQLTAAQLSSHLRFDCEISLVHQESGCVVDLHWGLAPKRFHFALNPGDFFQRVQTITLGNNTLRTFSNEDLVVFLCMHGAKHLWVRLEWISSLAELIRNSEGINWVTVVENARRSYSLRRLLLGLMLAKDLRPDIEIPEQVFAAVPNIESLQRCGEGVRERIFQILAPNKIEAFLFNLEVMDHKRDAIAGLFLFVLVPRISDWQGAPLPDALYPLYYLLRPLRLAAQFISALGKWIRSRKRFLMKSSPLP